MQRGLNYYTRLGLSKDASSEEIRSAYHAAALRLHPDVNERLGDTELFLSVQEAYEVLSNPSSRAEYDSQLSPEVDLQPVACKRSFSRSMLPHLQEPQLVYVLLELLPTPDYANDVPPPLNVCLVLDRSTSMQGSRLDTVKDTALKLLEKLRPDDILSIVAFSDRATLLLSGGERKDPWQVKSDIQLLQAGGGTEIYQGLEAGFLEVRRHQNITAVNHLILLTDGRTYGDERACQLLADQAAGQGIGISCIGVGNEWNDAFLEDLANRTGGNCIYASKPEQIERTLMEKFASLGHIYANGVTLEGKASAGIELQYAFRLDPEIGDLQTEFPIHLGAIPKNGTTRVVLEFLLAQLPSDIKQVSIFEGQVCFEIPGRPQPEASLYLNLSLPVGSAPPRESPPRDLVEAVGRLTLYRMQESARKDITTGSPAHAARRLAYLATHLLSLGERELTSTVLREADHLHQGSVLTEEGEKQIKYGTRALVLPPTTKGIAP